MNDDELQRGLHALVDELEPGSDAARVALERASRRRLPTTAVVAALGVLLLALGGAFAWDHQGGDRSPTASVGATDFDPVDLVGRWSVSAPGVEAGAILRVSDDITLFLRCGELFGTWSGNPDGAVAVTTFGYSNACTGTFSGPPTWLTNAHSGRRTTEGVQLLDEHGHVLATLTPGPVPTQRLDTSTPTDVPTASPELVARLHATGAVPSGLRAATRREVIGHWRPDPQSQSPSSLTINVDGSWVSNDGCNDTTGSWRMGDDGALTTSAGGSTLVACRGSSAPGEWNQARRVAFDGTTMVLVGGNGHELARLVRDTTPACAPGQLTASLQSQGISNAGPDRGQGMGIVLRSQEATCLFSGTVTVTAVDATGTALAEPSRVTGSRPVSIQPKSGQVVLNVFASFSRDRTTGGACAEDDVKPAALHVTSAQLGDLTLPLHHALRTCRGQLDPAGSVEAFGG